MGRMCLWDASSSANGCLLYTSFAAETGLECLEVACWPSSGGAKRRYAGTCHIDAQALTKARADEINAYLAKKHVTISALAYYPNTLDPDLEKREAYIRHLRMLIEMCIRDRSRAWWTIRAWPSTPPATTCS